MVRLLLARIGVGVVLVWATATLTFGLIYLAPGDPATTLVAREMGRVPRPGEVELYRALHGLGRSPLDQYAFWFAEAVRGNLGQAAHTGRPVVQEIGGRLAATLQLAAAAFALAVATGVPLGVAAGARPGGRVDRVGQSAAAIGVSMPNFWFGYLLILLFAGYLGWLPTHGTEGWRNFILPTLTLAVAPAARLSRLVRTSVADALALPHVVTAYAKGLSARAVVWRHGLRLAAVPVLTRCGLELAHLLTGTILVEAVFAWPGIGSFYIQAIEARDIPAIQGAVLAFVTLVIIANLTADALSWAADPRLRQRSSA